MPEAHLRHPEEVGATTIGASWTATGAGWLHLAACTEADADQLFGRAVAGRAVRALCARCPVHLQCLAHALGTGEDSGVWGGLTPNDRRILLRTFPAEDDWHGRLLRGGTHGLAADVRDSGTAPAALRVARRLEELP